MTEVQPLPDMAEPGEEAAPAAVQPVLTATPRLPLYLEGRQPLIVDLNGPALLVKSETRASGRFPLQRLSRVIAGQQVQWRTRALLACLEQGIAVIFVDGRGRPAGYLHAMNEHASRLDQLIRETLSRPDWQETYKNWLRAEHMRVLHAWRAGQEAAGNIISEQAFQRLVRRHIYQGKHASQEEHDGFYQAAIAAMLASMFRRAGLEPRYWGMHGHALDLIGDLTRVLLLRLMLEIGEFGSGFEGQADLMLRVFHSQLDEMDQSARAMLGRLHRHIKEQLETWR